MGNKVNTENTDMLDNIDLNKLERKKLENYITEHINNFQNYKCLPFAFTQSTLNKMDINFYKISTYDNFYYNRNITLFANKIRKKYGKQFNVSYTTLYNCDKDLGEKDDITWVFIFCKI